MKKSNTHEEPNIEFVTSPVRLFAPRHLAAALPNLDTSMYPEAMKILEDPPTKAALTDAVLRNLLSEAAMVEVSSRRACAAANTAAAEKERSRLASIRAAQNGFSQADVSSLKDTITFLSAWPISWTCRPMLQDSGHWQDVAAFGQGVGADPESVIAFMCRARGAGMRGEDTPKRLGVSVKASRLVILSGTADELVRLSQKFPLPLTMVFRGDGRDFYVFQTSDNVTPSCNLFGSLRLDIEGTMQIPPSTGYEWTLTPSQFAKRMTAEQTNLPTVPDDLLATLKDLRNCRDDVRGRYFNLLLENVKAA